MEGLRTKEFFSFMRKREAIRTARALNQPWPWTDDVIFQQYKFTNIKREHDKTSRLLIEEFYRPNARAKGDVILFNATVARYFGTIEMMRAVGWTDQPNKRALERIRKIARERMARGERVFTGAYMISNLRMPNPKEDIVCDVYLKGVMNHADLIVDAILKQYHWRDAIEALREVRGFGGTGFMAKEVISDTRYTDLWPSGTPKDVNTWTPVGPGSKRGAARVLGRTERTNKGKIAKLTEDETLAVCLALFGERDKHWPKGPKEVVLELHDIQFQLCEFDKYERVRLGEGRPRSLYRHSKK